MWFVVFLSLFFFSSSELNVMCATKNERWAMTIDDISEKTGTNRKRQKCAVFFSISKKISYQACTAYLH